MQTTDIKRTDHLEWWDQFRLALRSLNLVSPKYNQEKLRQGILIICYSRTHYIIF